MRKMLLDKTKRYRFAGQTFQWMPQVWQAPGRPFNDDEFQYFADAGLVEEDREPRRLTVAGRKEPHGFMLWSISGLGPAVPTGTDFVGTLTEVIK